MSVLDVSVLQQSTGGDDDFARELFGEYQQRVQELLDVMDRAAASADGETLRKAAHELKGSSLTLGALQVAGTARLLEDLCKRGEVSGVVGHVANVHGETRKLFAHLGELGYL